jgi:hypothetical protein
MIYHPGFLKMINVNEKICRENTTCILYSKSLFLNSAFYEEMWKIKVESDRPQKIICHMQMTNSSHSEYVKYILFQLQ